MTKRRPTRALAAVALVALSTAACSVGGDHDHSATDTAQAADQAVLGDHDFAIDMRKPPSRSALRMGPGGQIDAHSAPDGKDFRFTVVLADGQRFTTPTAAYLDVTAGGDLSTVDIDVDEHAPTPGPVIRQRLAALRRLGLTAAQENEAIRAFTKPESQTQTRAYSWAIGRPSRALITVKLVVGDGLSGKRRWLGFGYTLSGVRLGPDT